MYITRNYDLQQQFGTLGNINCRNTKRINKVNYDIQKRKYNALTCFRFNQAGYKVIDCPYSFKELSKLEDKNKLDSQPSSSTKNVLENHLI